MSIFVSSYAYRMTVVKQLITDAAAIVGTAVGIVLAAQTTMIAVYWLIPELWEISTLISSHITNQ